MQIRRVRRTAIVTAVLAACLLSCSAGADDTSEGTGTRDTSRSSSASAPADAAPQETGSTNPTPPASPGPELVRDAFAGLQATLDDTCTPGSGDCAYFLGRVHEELMGLDAAMKADPKGPGHFPEPITWIADLRKTLDGDTSTENLETHRTELIDVRDRINGWMQDHPDDYR
ncbi:hypothetical protein [Streptomyces jeddahensis]|uniref:Lipoprotein n=1 Tax=Streptomyces jeddahensis TaxID=1716141 RepID=A0A177HI22_9ACTN|nr:hypothetical protein [Streptomyces jeddahensis]OAH10239.1 hypothetical protein STSP_64950 [Streptomyces jeddahensis]